MIFNKIFTFFLILFNVFTTYSQLYSGKIHYKKQLISDSKSNDTKQINSYLSKKDIELKKTLDDINFILQFNKEESLFFVENINMEVEENRYYKLSILTGGNSGIWYLNSKDKSRLRQINAFGQDFLIKSNMNSVSWELINESKKIGNYICFKATSNYVVNNSKGTFNHPVVAWYTDKLPINFGPIGYGGLPGLIMELSVRNVKYYINKIELNPKIESEIMIPTKGKMVSEEEFEEIGKNMMQSFKKAF
ncbi:GLPGLI family protein [uncultured Lutibacter sp.]|uniref:GLPGLI family protein n=1 Tax=uncultured Lutibacter sp. TaxID=437739 RepID=UPI00263054B6|nr:GLPGLI family protein [uncultured Lutibacter sp.]